MGLKDMAIITGSAGKENFSMGKKNILIINPVSLFPTRIMSQVRTLNKIKRLSKDHMVDVITFCHTEEQKRISSEQFKNICRNFYPVEPINPKKKYIKKKYYGLKYSLLYYLFGTPKEYSYYGNNKVTKRILDIIALNDYDIIQIDYWYQGKILERADSEIFKSIDTHYLVKENKELHLKNKYDVKNKFFKTREFQKSEKLEKRFFDAADLIVPNSTKGKDILDLYYQKKKAIVVQNGQDIGFYENYKTVPEQGTILFYGNMGARQNIKAFFRLWNNIFPIIKKQVPEARLIVVGSNPPEEIKKLHNGDSLFISGFVKDVRQLLGKSKVMIIPLEIGSGFRGRVVEVMAMGIPVIGTHNALDSIEMDNGIHGFISDSDENIAEKSVMLLSDNKLWQKMREDCIKFVSNKYSLDATFGKLSAFFSTINKN